MAISEADLIDDLKRIEEKIGETPSQNQYEENGGKYSVFTYHQRLGSWNEALVAAGMNINREYGSISEADLIEDLQRIEEKIGETPSQTQYKENGGEYSIPTFHRILNSWNNAIIAAGMEINQEQETAPEKLLEDLNYIANKIGKSPTTEEYKEHGEHSITAVRNAFGCWSDGIDAAGLELSPRRVSAGEILDDIDQLGVELGRSPTIEEYRKEGDYSQTAINDHIGSWSEALISAGWEANKNKRPERFIADINRVAEKVEKTPTLEEYEDLGKYGSTTLSNKFGGWNAALTAAGFKVNKADDVSVEELLIHLRNQVESTEKIELSSVREFVEQRTDYSHRLYARKLGGEWRAFVRAGIIPPEAVPLSEKEYESYIETAKDASDPKLSLFGLIRAFVGLPQIVIRHFNMSWIRRVDDDLQPTLLTVPSEYLHSTDDWVSILPSHYTTTSGNEKPTQIDSLLRWCRNEGVRINTPIPEKINAPRKILNRAGVDANPRNLRGTIATHLARLDVNIRDIRMQYGAEKTGWQRSLDDYLLYLYQFEEHLHDNYQPTGTYLDPDTGDLETI